MHIVKRNGNRWERKKSPDGNLGSSSNIEEQHFKESKAEIKKMIVKELEIFFFFKLNNNN